jgi:predicted transcriptional regulator
MTQLKLLEQHIAALDDDSLSKFREWFIEFDQARWDKKLAADSNVGKLDFLINAALTEHKERVSEIVQAQPDDSSFDEILRELAFARMVERGLADSRQGRIISNEEMGHRIHTWQQ